MRKALGKLLRCSLALSLVAMIGWYCLPKPELVNWQSYSTAFYDRNGELLRLTLADDDRYRLFAPLRDISAQLQEATVLYEDQYFYHHSGVNLGALARAFWQTYIQAERPIGASTISMQVARLRFRLHTRNWWGKLRQIICALQLERHYSKQEILQAYLNLASYGGNIEGIAAASLVYFRKKPGELTLPEALALAVIPQNPVKRNPQTARGYQQLDTARQRLFQRWQQYHPDNSDFDNTVAANWLELPLLIHKPGDLPFKAPHFITTLYQDKPYLNGHVETTIDMTLQTLLQKRVADYVAQHRQLGIDNAAALLINHHTMDVAAWVGSVDFHNARILGQVDGVTAKRSPGSALKPFVYGLAMDQGLIHPQSLMKDAPRRFAGYTPENFDRVFLGPLSATDALITSRNVPAVTLQSRLKAPNFYHLLQKAGVEKLRDESHYGLSLSLGGMEVTMAELAKLYATLPNLGRHLPLRRLLSKNNSGNREPNHLLSQEAAFLTLDMLRQNPPPDQLSGFGLESNRTPVGWKTGTSFAFRDAWAVGVAGPYVLAIWVGNFNGEGNPNFVGEKAAGPLLFSVLRDLQAREHWFNEERFDQEAPNGLNLAKVDVCAATGDLPGPYSPTTKKSWFIPGVSPIKVSTVHRAIPIDKTTGKRACWHDPQHTELKVYEFWPTDILKIYRQAGVQRRLPPPYQEDCGTNAATFGIQPPDIRTPSSKLRYTLRSLGQGDSETNTNNIPFQAVYDASVSKAYWFVDNTFVGTSAPEQPLLWQARPGSFTVRVVDSNGLADQVQMEVQVIQ